DGWGVAGQDVSAGVGDGSDGKAEGRWLRAKGLCERDDAAVADDVLDIGLFDPAIGFAGFQLEFGYGFDGVDGRDDLGVFGGELVCSRYGAGEGAIALFVEA